MKAKQLKVLLADDVQLELEIDKTFFQRSGFRVITAANGPAALALATAEHPDIVILDQVMPGLRGSEVCRLLKSRSDTFSIPVVITSGTDSPEVRRACAAAGADAFVAKSLGREAILETAARILAIPTRKTTRIVVFFVPKSIVGGKESLGKAIDLSEGGISIEANRRHDRGTLFSLRFTLPGEREEHRVGGRVSGVKEISELNYALAIEFVDMSEADRRRLNGWLDKQFALC